MKIQVVSPSTRSIISYENGLVTATQNGIVVKTKEIVCEKKEDLYKAFTPEEKAELVKMHQDRISKK